jgi:hypothetical protein
MQAFKPAMPSFEIEDKQLRIAEQNKLLEAPNGALYKSLSIVDRLVASNVASGGGSFYFGDEVSICDLCIFDMMSFMYTGCAPDNVNNVQVRRRLLGPLAYGRMATAEVH